MKSGGRNKAEKSGERSGRAKRRMTTHLEEHSIPNRITKICGSLGMRVQHSGESGQQSEAGY